MSRFVYDAAVLVAADRSERRTWADHRARLDLGAIPLVPVAVLAQVSRSSQQVQLRRFLNGCQMVAMGEGEAHEAGGLLSKCKTSDVVDAMVVVTARRHGAAVILTSDVADIERLVQAAGSEVAVMAV